MIEKVFTFWEGEKPAYIDLCMSTWKFPYVVLTYDNINEYTDISVDDKLKRFPLPMIADVVRAHVLRDQGGYWLDTDTVMISDELPTDNIKGYPVTRDHTWGYLYAEQPNMDFYDGWARYQDHIIEDFTGFPEWSLLSKDFTDPYIKSETNLRISPIDTSWPETYMIVDDIPRYEKYRQLYFGTSYQLSDLRKTDMLMLHNSWTPEWYKKLSKREALQQTCTLSNILRDLL